jgi:hypothetical protein
MFGHPITMLLLVATLITLVLNLPVYHNFVQRRKEEK